MLLITRAAHLLSRDGFRLFEMASTDGELVVSVCVSGLHRLSRELIVSCPAPHGRPVVNEALFLNELLVRKPT